jgi:capsular polysaccharide biosynthesis protein
MERIIYIDYMRCFRQVARKLPIALAVALLAGLAGATAGYFLLSHENRYEARSSVYTSTTNEYGNAAQGVQYADIARSESVALKALALIDDPSLTYRDVFGQIRVEYDKETPYVNSSAVIEIFASARDTRTAMSVANAVAKAFVAEVSGISKEGMAVDVLDIATSADQSYDASRALLACTLIAAALGLVLACAAVWILEALALRLVAVTDGTLYGKLELVGVIPVHTPYAVKGQRAAPGRPAAPAARQPQAIRLNAE